MQSDITIRADHPHPDFHEFARSHFSSGVLTLQPGYLFRTPPGWDMWAAGPPNWPKDGIQPLSGLVETDWLPFPFTMNWIFTRPGRIRFEKGEPFCFITLTPHRVMDEVQPIQRSFPSDMALKEQYEVVAPRARHLQQAAGPQGSRRRPRGVAALLLPRRNPRGQGAHPRRPYEQAAAEVAQARPLTAPDT